MLGKALDWASVSIGAPLLGNMEMHFFNRAFLFRGIYMRFLREMQMPSKWVSLSIGALLGNLERKKKQACSMYNCTVILT